MTIAPWAWTAICVSIVVTWIVLNIADVLLSSYHADPGINIVAGAIAGSAGVNGYMTRKRANGE